MTLAVGEVQDANDQRVLPEGATEPWIGARLLPESRAGLIAVAVTVAILAVLGVAGISPLVRAAFKPSVSERVSKKVGRPVSCTRVGVTSVVGRKSNVYRCESDADSARSAGCYSVVDGRVFPVYSLRRVRC